MAVPVSWWNRLSWLAVFLMFAAGGVAAAFWIQPQIRINQELQRRKIALAGELDALKQQIAQYRFRVDQWQNNSNAVERLARETLRYSSSGETIIFFQPPPPHITDFRPAPGAAASARPNANH